MIPIAVNRVQDGTTKSLKSVNFGNHFPAAYKDLFCMQSYTETCCVLQLAEVKTTHYTYTLRCVSQVSIVVELVVARSSELAIANMCWRRTRQLTPSPWRNSKGGSYYLTSWKLKGSRNCFEVDGEEKEDEGDGEVKEVRGNAHFMHG